MPFHSTNAAAMPLIALSVVLQLACLVHCMRNGSSQRWAWILIIGSYIGVIAYLVVEIIPNLRHSPVARRAARRVVRTLDPERERRRAAQELELNSSIANRRRLAEELSELGDHAGAAELYTQALASPMGDDPYLLLGLARAQYGLQQPQAVRATLDELIRRYPDFRSPEGHFLFARALSDLGEHAAADQEFAALLPGFSGEEARVWYARSLVRQGRTAQARTVYEEVLKRVKLSPAYYRKNEREWVRAAQQELRVL